MTCSLIPHHPKILLSVGVVKLHSGTIGQGHIRNFHLPPLEHYSSLSHTLRITSLVNTSQHERGEGLFLYSPGIMWENFRHLAGHTLDQPKPKVQQEWQYSSLQIQEANIRPREVREVLSGRASGRHLCKRPEKRVSLALKALVRGNLEEQLWLLHKPTGEEKKSKHPFIKWEKYLNRHFVKEERHTRQP